MNKIIHLATATAFFFLSILPVPGFTFNVSVTQGNASVTTNGNTVTITATGRAILQGSASIPVGTTVKVVQGINDILLRDTSGGVTNILGSLLSNGNIILINAMGVFIGQSANINVGGLIASTLDIKNQMFMSGNYQFEKIPGLNPAQILNEANITVAPGGYVILLGDSVVNKGTITAYMGTVALGSGQQATVSFDQGGTINLVIDKGLAQQLKDSNGNSQAQIVNSGVIQANGGKIQLTAKLLETALEQVVNNTGLIEANNVVAHEGVVDLTASGAIDNSGTIQAGILNEQGETFRSTGTLDVGHGYFDNLDGAINISGNIAGPYSDVANVNFIGDVTLIGDTTLQADSGGTGTQGQIIMNGNSLTGGGFNLTLTAGLNDTLDGSITGVNLLTLNSSTSSNVTFTSTGPAFSVNTLQTNYHSLFSRSQGAGTSISPYMVYSVSNAVGGLQYIATEGLGAFYQLANNINAAETSSWNAGAGFAPIGTIGTPFTGTFNGNSFTISHFFINLPSTNGVGLFRVASGATIENVGLLNVSITGQYSVGGLAGYTLFSSNIDNSYVTGSISGTAYRVGGLVGANENSSITNSYATSSENGFDGVGGLAGYSYTGNIDNSYATGDVNGRFKVGGLVGGNNGSSIANSYAIGTVTGSSKVGGLVGANYSSSVDNSYATGSVSGSSKVGGLVGYNATSSSIVNSFATGVATSSGDTPGGLIGTDDGSNTDVNNWWYNATNGAGVGNSAPAGVSEAGAVSDFFNPSQSVYTGVSPWDISSGTGHTWAMSGDNDAYPLLQFRYSTTITDDYQLQLMFLNPGASYSLANNIDATNTLNWNAGGGFAPISSFYGSFNGNNYTISNLFIDMPTTDEVSLFGDFSGNLIENVGLLNVNFTGRSFVAGIAGWNNGGGSISNSYATGTVTGAGNYVGGITGDLNGSTIDNSYASANVSGANNVGGLVGESTTSSTIINSYATGTVSGNNNVGGLVGRSHFDSVIDHSYATGTVSGAGSVGGLIGYNNFNSTLANSFATGVASGGSPGGLIGTDDGSNTDINNWWYNATNGAGVGNGAPAGVSKATAVSDFYSAGQAVYNGTDFWDFNYTWIPSGISYPTLGINPLTDIWIGSGNWSVAGNWSRDLVPTNTIAVLFNGNSVNNSTIDSSFAGLVANLKIDSAYTGTISQDANLGISGNYIQNSGSFVSDPTKTFTVGNSFNLNGGTFSRFTGAGTSGSPYLIYDVYGLQGMGGFSSDTFGLANNIDATTTSGWNGGMGFNPIGFAGTFNGNSYTISNLFIDRPLTYDVGLFGYTYGGTTIENIGLLNANITGYSYTGGLVGSDRSSSITNSYVTGSVRGSSYVGGLVGYNYSSNIDNSYTSSSVNGKNSVGGLVGSNYSSSIDNNYATGNVSGSSQVGGLVGYNFRSGSIDNSYATGSVGGSSKVGGLVGNNANSSRISNSFATGVATSSGDTPGGLIGADDGSAALNNNWWYNATNGAGVGNSAPAGVSEAGAASDFYSTAQAVYNGAFPWDFNFTWLASGISYPTFGINPNTDIWSGSGNWSVAGNWSRNLVPTNTISVLFNGSDTNNSTIDASFAGLVANLKIDSGYTGTISQDVNLAIGGNYIQNNGSFVSDPTKTFTVGNSFNLNGGTFSRFTGAGTGGSPYLIYDVYGLQGMGGFLSSTFGLANDIDASSTSSWNLGAGFIPVGNSTTPFTGTFNGNNYTISDLFIDPPSGRGVGLFGYTHGSTIGNVGLLNVNITGYDGVGGLVGYNNYSSSIDNSYTTGSVSGTYGVGGLVGYNENSSSIDNSYSTSNLNGGTGSYAIGGLVGGNGNTSTISNSYATGNVTSGTGSRSTGGLAGSNFSSSIDNSYATGSVNGVNYVGGMVGYNGDRSGIDNSYATGSVSGSSKVGGLVGSNENSSSISNSFATGVATSTGDTPGGLIGNDDGTNTLTNNWWYNATNGGGVGNSAPAGVSEAGAASDFYSTAQAVYNGVGPWDFNYTWIASGISYPTFGINPNTDIWSGSGNWSVAGNWSRNLVPTNTISVLFNASDTNNSTIDASFAGLVANLKIDSGYTGTISQDVNLAIGGNFIQNSGSFVSDPTKTFTVGNSFNLNGGTFSRFTGAGTGGSPYLIYDIYGLQAMEEYLSNTFGLANNIDASGTPSWFSETGGLGFIPVGNSTTPFTGTFNGNNYTISDLFIDLPSGRGVGLFGYTHGSTIGNVGLLSVNITGYDGVGGLVGYNENSSSVDDSYTTGSVRGSNEVGGLVGFDRNSSSIDNSYATDSVSGSYAIGGLVGYNFGSSSIDNSYATGSVSGSGYYFGGLVGFNSSSSIANSYATGSVSGSGTVGGLVGFNFISSSIANSYATGSVSGSGTVGGLVGYNASSSSIDNSFATGVATSTGDTPGGLIGHDDGTHTLTNNWWYNATNTVGVGNSAPAGVSKAGAVTNFFNSSQSVYTGAGPWDISSSTGHIWAMSGDDDAYPLLQFRYSTSITDDYQLQLMFLNLGATYTLANNINAADTSSWNSGLGFAPIGISSPFTGTFNGNNYTISNLFIGRSAMFNVGLLGSTSGAIIENIGLLNANITGQDGVGALVGYNSHLSSVDNSYATGSVSGSGGEVGGLVGYNGNSSNIDNSYANVSVSGSGSGFGGLVGVNSTSSSITASYAAGSVSGSTQVGGLVGLNYFGSITDSYATGSVSGSGTVVGGLVGYNFNSGTITNSYATGTVSGSGEVGGLVGGNGSLSGIFNSFATGVATSTGDTPGGLIGNDDGTNTLTNNWWYNATNGSGVGNSSPGGVSEAGAASDFYSTAQAVYNGTTPWDFNFTWLASGVSYPTLGINPNTDIWSGSGNWSLASNWSRNLVPTSTISVLFNGSDTNNSTIDASFAGLVANLKIDSGYTGTISQDVNLAISGNYTQNGGSFVSDPTKTFTVGNSFDLNGGTFSRFTGAGTGGSPYLIYDVYGLQGMGGFLSSTFELANDIDASSTSSWFAETGGLGFSPIGNNITPYTGTLNGNGFTISHLFIDLPITNGVGLFGYTSGAAIENVGLLNVNVTGQNGVGGFSGYNRNSSSIDSSYVEGSVNGSGNVGGLVGYNAFSSTIDNSYATGNVSGSGNIGGLVGWNFLNTSISNSYTTSNVSGTKYVGGLVGYNFESSIDNSYATGNVSGSGNEIGGLVGYNFHNSSIDNSYATGSVSGSGVVGGLVGDNGFSSSIVNSYAIGSVSGSAEIGGLVGSNRFTSSISNSFATGVATSSGDTPGGLIGNDDGTNTLTNNWWYNATNGVGVGNSAPAGVSKAGAVTDFFNSSQSVYIGAGPWDISSSTGHIWAMSGDNDAYPLLQFRYSTNITDDYQLQLMFLNLGATYTLANDISAADTSNWNSGLGFAPVGISSPFTGTFNGNSNTIDNLFINRPALNDVGLFGQTSGATIQNVGLTNVNITGQNLVGALTGDNDAHSFIDNAYAAGTVTSPGGEAIGGLAGFNNNHSVIDNSYANVTVSAGSEIGGLIGSTSDYSTVDNSYAIGNVTGTQDTVGGLVGRLVNHSSVSNSYAAGSVTGQSDVGGLVGHNYNSSIIDNSYAVGVATSSGDTPGGFIGNDDGTNTFTNNWWYNATNGAGVGNSSPAGVSQASGLSDFYGTGGGTGGAVYSTWDFNFDWLSNAGTYPTLGINPNTDIWVGSGNWSVAANWSRDIVPTAGISVLFNSSDDNSATVDASFAGLVANLKIDSGYTGTVTQSQGLSISGSYIQNNGTFDQNANLSVAGNFSQSGGTFVSNPTKTFSADSFSLTGGTFNRFTGSGTLVSPYLIYDVYGLQGMSDYLGDYFKLNNNIDASGTSNWNSDQGFVPVGNSTTSFTGNFNGNSKTIDSLFIDLPTSNDVGLFGYTNGSTIHDVGLTNMDITGKNYVGGLVGYSFDHSTISNSYASGTVTGMGTFIVGGLVGYNFGHSAIDNSYASGSVTGVGSVGGLVGGNYTYSTIDNSYANESVTGSGTGVGGLVGENYVHSTIDNSYAMGSVTGSGNEVGGLVGVNGTHASINNSYASGGVAGNNIVGGLVGYNYKYSNIDNSYVSGSVVGTSKVGGLVGLNNNHSTISNAYATGVATSTGDTPGGLIGNDDGTNTLTNNWWYNATNGAGVGNSSPAGVSKAGALSDFYGFGSGTGEAVYSAWDFTTPVWDAFVGIDPHLHWEHFNGTPAVPPAPPPSSTGPLSLQLREEIVNGLPPEVTGSDFYNPKNLLLEGPAEVIDDEQGAQSYWVPYGEKWISIKDDSRWSLWESGRAVQEPWGIELLPSSMNTNIQ